MVISVGRFVPLDVLSMGCFVRGMFCPWDVLFRVTVSLGTFFRCTFYLIAVTWNGAGDKFFFIKFVILGNKLINGMLILKTTLVK